MKHTWLVMACLIVMIGIVGPSDLLGSTFGDWQDQEASTNESAQDEAEQDEEKTPMEQFQKIVRRFDEEMMEFRKAYAKAKPEERNELVQNKLPRAEEYADELFEFAKANKDDQQASFIALNWVMSRARGTEASSRAMNILLTDHIDNEGLGDLAFSLAYGEASESTEKSFKRLMEDSPHKNVRGQSTFAYAMYLSRMRDVEDREAHNERMESLYKLVVDEYGDVKMRNRSLASLAKGALFEIQRLQIGMEVPEIEGEDLDGVSFKLSDYRGKVVVIDFWGDW